MKIRVNDLLPGRRASRRPLIIGCLLAILLQGMLPSLAFAGGCGVTDPGACMDGMHYSLWYGLASWLWKLDSLLLQLVYSLDQLRVWIIETAFASVYQSLSRMLSPFIVPFASLALILGLLFFFLMPLTGKTRLMNVRHVLMWTIFAPLALTLTGQVASQVEQGRVTIGATIMTEISQALPGDIFGVRATDMRRPTPLYNGGNPCGTGALNRPGTGASQTTLRMDDLAAALLWADAEDIHCMKAQGPGVDLPDAFYLDPPDGPKYAVEQDVGEMPESSDRKAAISNMQRGTGLLALAIIPCFLAVLEAFIQLLFGLALVAVWMGVPLAVVFIFFEDSSASMLVLFRQAVDVLITSWKSSIFLALMFGALLSAAEMGSAGVYIGCSLGSIFVLWTALTSARELLNRSMGSFKASAMLGFAGGAAGAVIGAVAGTAGKIASTATAGAASYRQSGGNLRYTLGTMLGNFAKGPGEVAMALGGVKDEEIMAGINAGGRWQDSVRAGRLQMQSDAKRPLRDGVTLKEAAYERRLARRLTRIQQPSEARDVTNKLGAVRRGVQYFAGGDFDEDVGQVVTRAAAGVERRWQALKTAKQEVGDEIHERVPNPDGSLGSKLQVAAAGASVLYDRLAPDKRYHAYQLNEDGRIVGTPEVPAEELPEDAQLLPRKQANMPRLMRQGYTVQQLRDGRVAAWKPAPPAETPTVPLTVNTDLTQPIPAPQPRVTRQLTLQMSRQRKTQQLTYDTAQLTYDTAQLPAEERVSGPLEAPVSAPPDVPVSAPPEAPLTPPPTPTKRRPARRTPRVQRLDSAPLPTPPSWMDGPDPWLDALSDTPPAEGTEGETRP